MVEVAQPEHQTPRRSCHKMKKAATPPHGQRHDLRLTSSIGNRRSDPVFWDYSKARNVMWSWFGSVTNGAARSRRFFAENYMRPKNTVFVTSLVV